VIAYLTEEEHVERMARAIWECHQRRDRLVIAWDALREETRAAYRRIATGTIAAVDALR